MKQCLVDSVQGDEKRVTAAPSAVHTPLLHLTTPQEVLQVSASRWQSSTNYKVKI